MGGQEYCADREVLDGLVELWTDVVKQLLDDGGIRAPVYEVNQRVCKTRAGCQ